MGTFGLFVWGLCVLACAGIATAQLSAVFPQLNLLDAERVSEVWNTIFVESGFVESDLVCVKGTAQSPFVGKGCECSVSEDVYEIVWVETTLGAYAPQFLILPDNLTQACLHNATCGRCAAGMECVGIANSTSGQDSGICSSCSAGQYCPASVVNPIVMVAANICPAGAFCSKNATQKYACPPGFYCPEGTTDPITCDIASLQTGRYCAENSTHPRRLCPAGYFCPNVSTKIECPRGNYCPSGSQEPRSCQWYASCGVGEDSPPVSYVGTALAFACMILAVGVGYLGRVHYSKYQQDQKRENMEIDELRKMRAQLFELLSGRPMADYKFSGFSEVETPLAISFENLSLRVNDTGKTVLHGTTGEFQPGRLYAIMGPSGSGKTSFLNAVTGKAKAYGHIGGTVRVNGVEMSPSAYRKTMGFVPQQDIVHTNLTVRENLLFSARLRLPPSTTPETLDQIVQDVILVLQLSTFEDQLVGSIEEKRRISGGQRKRVSVGVELVASPTLLFLDEPTTGLDATAAYEVVSALKSMSRLGWTVVTVIHQPRFSVFQMFDYVLFLGMGGYTVYLGPAAQSAEYFREMGFELPENENPADTMMDIIAGKEQINGKTFDSTRLPSYWQEQKDSFLTKHKKLNRKTRASVHAVDRFRLLQTLESRFDELDQDHTGKLSVNEFETLIAQSLGLKQVMPEMLTLVHKLFEHTDHDMDGNITKDELTELVFADQTHKHPIRRDDSDISQSDSVVDFHEMLDRVANLVRLSTKAAKSVRAFVSRAGERCYTPTLRGLATRTRSITGDMTDEEKTVRQLGTKPNGLFQFFEFFQRSFIQNMRAVRVKLFEIVVLASSTFIVGTMQGASVTLSVLTTNITLGFLAFALLSCAASLKTMGTYYEKLMFWREAAAGVNRFAYFAAKNVADFADVLLRALMFSLIFYYLTIPEISFGDFFVVSLLHSWATSGTGYMCSTLLRWGDAQVLGLVYTLVFGGFLNGTDPPLRKYKGNFLEYVVMLSPNRWAVEAVTVRAAKREVDLYPQTVSDFIDQSGFELDNYTNDLVGLIVLGILYRLFSFLFLIFVNRGKQI